MLLAWSGKTYARGRIRVSEYAGGIQLYLLHFEPSGLVGFDPEDTNSGSQS